MTAVTDEDIRNMEIVVDFVEKNQHLIEKLMDSQMRMFREIPRSPPTPKPILV
jgi:hypothetical protein